MTRCFCDWSPSRYDFQQDVARPATQGARFRAVGTHLARIGVIENPQCWWCDQAEQSVEHLYTKCRKWRKERRKLLRKFYKEGVRWQG